MIARDDDHAILVKRLLLTPLDKIVQLLVGTVDDVGKTVADILSVKNSLSGKSFLKEIL